MALVFCDSFDHYSTIRGPSGAEVSPLWIGEAGSIGDDGYRCSDGLSRKWDGNDEGVSNWVIYPCEGGMKYWSRRPGGMLGHWGGYSGVIRKHFKETYNGVIFGFWYNNNSSWCLSDLSDRLLGGNGVWSYSDLYGFASMRHSPQVVVLDRNSVIIAALKMDDYADTGYIGSGSVIKRRVIFGCTPNKIYRTNNFAGSPSSSLHDYYENSFTYAVGEYPHYTSDWHHVEFKVVFHETNGSYEVRYDGSTIYSQFGIPTIGAGHAVDPVGGPTINSIAICKNNWDVTLIQDLYVLDTSGSVGNDLLGPYASVKAYVVNENNGNYNQWSGTVANNKVWVDLHTSYQYWDSWRGGWFTNYTWSVPDYIAPYIDYESYASTNTQGAAETYTYEKEEYTPEYSNIQGIQKVSALKKTDAGTMKLKHRLRISSTDYDSEEFRIQDKLKHYCKPYSINPATGSAWTFNEVESIEGGLVVSTW